MPKYELTYGESKLTLEFPEEFLAGELVLPKKPQPPQDGLSAKQRIAAALKNPVGLPTIPELVRGKRVAIVVSDEFRSGRQKEITELLIEQVAAGDPAFATLIVATGTHDPDIYAVNVSQWANDAATRLGFELEVVANDCDNAEQFAFVGKTSFGTEVWLHKRFLEAEVRIYGHEAKHHYMCGYSNIDKMVIPGVSARKTVEQNHKRALDHTHAIAGRSPWHTDESRRFNPFAMDANEARELARKVVLNPSTGTPIENKQAVEFGLDMVSDKQDVYWVSAGDVVAVEREMVKVVDRMAMFEFKPVKYVVISPGGPPASQTVYSTQNCFDMALKGAIQNGGEALVLAPCDGRPDVPEDTRGLAPDRKSRKLFWDNLVNLLPLPLEEAAKYIDEHFELYLWKTDRVLKLFKESNIKVYLYSTLPDEVVRKAGFIPVHDPQEWITERAARHDGKCRAIDHGNKMLIVPKPDSME